MHFTSEDVRKFFRSSDTLDHLVLRPLSHIYSNWELEWNHDTSQYDPEYNSFAEKFNLLVEELSHTEPPRRYHDNEDGLAQHVATHLNWGIRKLGNQWVGTDLKPVRYYAEVLEQGSLNHVDQQELILAAAGRIRAALVRGQNHIDEMEETHAKMLGAVLSIILFHRFDSLSLPPELPNEAS